MNAPDWAKGAIAEIDEKDLYNAQQYQNTLTKPSGSLGALEDIAIKFVGWQKTLKPCIESIAVRVFAADHGVCKQGVSAFPQIVTTQMIHNFVTGGAAISVLSRQLNADFAVVNLGTAHPLIDESCVIQKVIAEGTQDFTQAPAMTINQCLQALDVGRFTVKNLNETDLFVGGEMGIGNTTSASAIYTVLLGIDPQLAVGPGTGVDEKGLEAKRKAIIQGLALHEKAIQNPFGLLMCLGGFEIAALTGAYIACAQAGIPIIVDGFISTAAALLAEEISPGVSRWVLFSHCSAEPAHSFALDKFGVKPLLSIGMCLGEGSGAAVAVSLIQSALNLHNNMATFDDAGVSES